MKSKSLSRNGNYVERGIGEDVALNKSSMEVDFGNLIWVQLNGQSWLGQVLENWEYFFLYDAISSKFSVFLYVSLPPVG